MRIKKIIEMLEFHMRITKKHENLGIPHRNHKNYENIELCNVTVYHCQYNYVSKPFCDYTVMWPHIYVTANQCHRKMWPLNNVNENQCDQTILWLGAFMAVQICSIAAWQKAKLAEKRKATAKSRVECLRFVVISPHNQSRSWKLIQKWIKMTWKIAQVQIFWFKNV